MRHHQAPRADRGVPHLRHGAHQTRHARQPTPCRRGASCLSGALEQTGAALSGFVKAHSRARLQPRGRAFHVERSRCRGAERAMSWMSWRVGRPRDAAPGAGPDQKSGRLSDRRGKRSGQGHASVNDAYRGVPTSSRTSPSSARPAPGQRDGSGLGGSLTTSCPPARSSGAAHSATTPGGPKLRATTASHDARHDRSRPSSSARRQTTVDARARCRAGPPLAARRPCDAGWRRGGRRPSPAVPRRSRGPAARRRCRGRGDEPQGGAP